MTKSAQERAARVRVCTSEKFETWMEFTTPTKNSTCTVHAASHNIHITNTLATYEW